MQRYILDTFGVESLLTLNKPSVTSFNCKTEAIGEHFEKFTASVEGRSVVKSIKNHGMQCPSIFKLIALYFIHYL